MDHDEFSRNQRRQTLLVLFLIAVNGRCLCRVHRLRITDGSVPRFSRKSSLSGSVEIAVITPFIFIFRDDGEIANSSSSRCAPGMGFGIRSTSIHREVTGVIVAVAPSVAINWWFQFLFVVDRYHPLQTTEVAAASDSCDGV